MIRTISLSKLVPSPRNVRRATDAQADLELKADIAARGLLQNLVVTAARKPRGCFAVEAGERRRRALLALAAEGVLAADFEVACLVVGSAADGHEASLAENFQRLAMNSADECLAFQALVENGSDVEGIARRFGLTRRFVEGRLRLAGLAPAIFDALGAGTISLDLAKAYAATPDHERQVWVFDQLSGYPGCHPDSVRRMMIQATVSAADRRARLVGEEAYLAAGGRIEQDLFEPDGAARWLDVALLERLAIEKMDLLAAEAATASGLAFVRPTLDTWVGYGRRDGLVRVAVEPVPPSEEEQASIDALQAEIDALADLLDDEDAEPSAQDAAEVRVAELAAQIEAIADKPPVLDDALKGQVGTFLLLGEDGVPRLDRGYFRELGEDAANRRDEGVAGASRVEHAGREKKPAGLAQRLIDELAIQRRDVLALHLAVEPAMALDLAVFLMADRETGGSWGDRSGSSLLAIPPGDPVFGFRTPDAPATLGRAQQSDALDRSWTEGETRAERFDAFRALDDDARWAWLGHCVAMTLEASVNHPGARSCALHDHLGRLLGIEVARWWRPTGANYFDRVPKSMALVAMAEVGGTELAARYGKAKKAELAQACERLCAGELVVEAEVRAAALAWVPEAMRFAAPRDHAAEADGELPDEGELRGEDAVSRATVATGTAEPKVGVGVGLETEAEAGAEVEVEVEATGRAAGQLGAINFSKLLVRFRPAPPLRASSNRNRQRRIRPRHTHFLRRRTDNLPQSSSCSHRNHQRRRSRSPRPTDNQLHGRCSPRYTRSRHSFRRRPRSYRGARQIQHRSHRRVPRLQSLQDRLRLTDLARPIPHLLPALRCNPIRMLTRPVTGAPRSTSSYNPLPVLRLRMPESVRATSTRPSKTPTRSAAVN